MARVAEAFMGARFGRLVVVGERTRGARSRVPVRCDCGTEKTVAISCLGGTLSCGCKKADEWAARRTRHGMRDAPEYSSWQGMLARCHNPKSPRYSDYGGRGIAVCDEWRESFAAFFEHVGPKPTPAHSVDRIDNESGYLPGNVRWASPTEQAGNRRPRRLKTHLTPRMVGALTLDATGMPLARIDQEMGMPAYSASTYLALARKRLGAADRAEAIQIARERGLIPTT